ncbi:ribosome-binding factor A [Candidatus Kaiserbacteria bacterium]|nr:ribosome-binding factor A [Candidatus Kaiserbacteria bacterium]
MSRHENRVAEQIAHEAALFIQREASSASLITVTRALMRAHGQRATVFVSVFPAEESRAALHFLEGRRETFSEHLKQHTRLRPLPHVTFLLDDGNSLKT